MSGIVSNYEIMDDESKIRSYLEEYMNECSNVSNFCCDRYFHYKDFTINIRYNGHLFCGYIRYDGDDDLISEFLYDFENLYNRLDDFQKTKITLPEGGFAYGTAYDTGMANSRFYGYESGFCNYQRQYRGFLTHHFVLRELKRFIDSILDTDIIPTTKHLHVKHLTFANLFN